MSEKKRTGYPSIDRPWLDRFTEEVRNNELDFDTPYRSVVKANKPYLNLNAINYFGKITTYREFLANIEQTAAAFEAMGLKAGDTVYLTANNSPEVLYTFYGANKIGVIVNFIDPRSDDNILKHYISVNKPNMWITLNLNYEYVRMATEGMDIPIVVLKVSESMPFPINAGYNLKERKKFPNIPFGGNIMHWSEFMAKGEGKVALEAPLPALDDCAMIVHTGGTSGTPKSARYSGRNFNAACKEFIPVCLPVDVERGMKWYNELPTFIAYCICLLHIALSFGGLELIMNPQFDPANVAKQYHKYQFNAIAGVPEHFARIARDPITQNDDFSKLVLSFVGGDSVTPELEEEYNSFIQARGSKKYLIKSYGMTENTCRAGVCSDYNTRAGSIGLPMPHDIAKIVDPDDITKECKYNESGEILLSGPGTMLDYMNDPEATAEKIYTDENGTRWVRTEDAGRIDEDGFLYIMGRMRRMYMVESEGLGTKIFPQVIESAIRQHPDVEDACVAGRKVLGSTSFNEMVAFVVKKNDRDDAELTEEIKKVVADNLPPYQHPVQYEYIEKIPVKPQNNKVDFVKAEEMAEQVREKMAG